MMKLQKSRSRFVEITARRHCRKLLRNYVEQEQEYRARLLSPANGCILAHDH